MTKEHIISTAGSLFYKEGVRAVGIDRIIADAGIAKATLYRHFASKEELIVSYLKARHEFVFNEIRHALDSAAPDLHRRLCALFSMLEKKGNSKEFRGCSFLLAVAEQEESEAIRSVAIMHKASVHQLFIETFGRNLTDPSAFASELSLLYDGALATIQLQRHGGAATTALRMATARLETMANSRGL